MSILFFDFARIVQFLDFVQGLSHHFLNRVLAFSGIDFCDALHKVLRFGLYEFSVYAAREFSHLRMADSGRASA